MKVQWHMATAVPFLLLGHIAGAIACVAPDLPWAVAEVRYRKWRGASATANRRTWYDWLWHKHGYSALPPWVIVAYRLTHSPFMLLLVAAWFWGWNVSGQHGGMPWAFIAGWAIHIGIDMFTHDGPLRMLWWYPLMRDPRHAAVPRSWIHHAFAIDRERGMTDVVCVSGGWESTACLIKAIERSRRTACDVVAQFVDYGQDNMTEERERATELCYMFNVPLRVTSLDIPLKGTLPNGRKVYRARNRAFILAAIHARPHETIRAVWQGYRAPLPVFDECGDSNRLWARKVGAWHRVAVVSGVVMWPKWAVKRFARNAGVRDSWIQSSEV